MKAIYIEYVDADSNKDGKLDEDDTFKVALLRPNGTGRVDVLQNVSQVLDYELIDATTLNVLYQQGTSVRNASISVVDFKVESDMELATAQQK